MLSTSTAKGSPSPESGTAGMRATIGLLTVAVCAVMLSMAMGWCCR